MPLRSERLVALALGLLTGCASQPQHYPSETAAGYVGKPLSALEIRWSVPYDIGAAGNGQKATWRFDQYNLAGCTVTAHTDSTDLIRSVSWTKGCGPKGTETGESTGIGLPY